MNKQSPFFREGDEQLIQDVRQAVRELRQKRDMREEDAILEALRSRSSQVGWRELDVLAWALASHSNGLPFTNTIPIGLVDVCKGLMPEGKPFELALDPCAGAGTLLAALLERGIVREARGAAVDSAQLTLNGVASLGALSLVRAEPEDWLRTQGRADLIVSVPPWDSCAHAHTDTWQGIRHIQHRLLLAASQCVHRGGRIVMVVPPSFFAFDREGDQTRKLLSAAGADLEAALFLPSGSLGETSIPGYAVVLSSGAFEQVFVGELSDSSQRNAVLTENLLARQAGATPGLGRLVPVHDFRGFPQLLHAEDEARLQRGSRYPFSRLKEVATSIQRLRDMPEKQRQDPNLLFLANTGPTAIVTTDISDVTGSEERWAVVTLRPERALAGYLCRFLNSDLGRKARLRLATGTSIQFIPREMMGEILVCVPPLEAQRVLLQLDARLTELRDGAETLRENLWSGHEEPENLARRIETIGSPAARAESVEDWMKDLPFPLASILRRHQRYQRDPEKAFHVLVHFFEAFAEFWATILLSALDRAKEIPSQTTKDVREYMAGKVLPIETSSLGTWNALGGKLASHFRRLLEDPKGKAEAPSANPLDYFATRDHGVVDRLLDKQISAILQQVGQLRNQGQAHGGVIGPKVAEHLYEQVRPLLAKLQRVVSVAFRSLRLVRIGEARLGPAVHTYTCDVLMGSDPQFVIESIELEELAHHGALHLVGTDRRALRLLPLVRMSAPQGGSNACYFYSKSDGKTARFVSYHQETEAVELNETPLDFLTRWNRDPEPDFPAE